MATAQLQSAIGTAETRLAGLLMGETEQNPQVTQARAELAALRAQLLRQQANTKTQAPGGGLASTAKLPALTLEYMRKARELKLRESIYDSLTQQYEKARIGSIDPGPQLQVVDRAMIPEQKAGPPRRLWMVGGAFAGLILGLIHVLVWTKFQRTLRELLSPPTAEVEG
ncbi:MAG: lipopolysaccharide biosynthesis protein [Acidobacteriaceae bacterium]|nr:lipopolysaccharide biosynthesis protein [Acidobacteriaceae bacterium]